MYEKQVTDFKDIASLSSSDIFVLLELILPIQLQLMLRAITFVSFIVTNCFANG